MKHQIALGFRNAGARVFHLEHGHLAKAIGQYKALLADLQALVVQKNEAGRTWLGGEHFGPLDAYALTLTRWGTIAGIAPEVHPVLWAFVEQVAKVPAVARVMERERLQLNLYKAP